MSEIIVGRRKTGKTKELVRIALLHFLKGDDVLVVGSYSVLREIYNQTKHECLTIDGITNEKSFKFNNNEKTITFKSSNKKQSVIKFITDEYYNSKSFQPSLYTDFKKIWDEYNFWNQEFDYVVLNGELGVDLNES